ncbi:leucine-rich repeat and WD repeat-containing protein 1-like [Neocloeon triangulifer]|uniref:leucine-rich repeat and WD repeat-containing protein 1-like n=1 Tax=Neocloeon triangulifer TaxID=2078957 RepID=UPI00286F0A4C|nr:leucine-rich repeat and WD repeat-containing protein 1-like [Neocloeon triangulifer]
MKDFSAQTTLDFCPVDFIRAHSADNSKSDIRTEIWQCTFQPDVNNPGKFTSLVATCGGNSVCVTDVSTSTVKYKFKAEVGEKLFALAWGTSLSFSANVLLAASGTGRRIFFISPHESSVVVSQVLDKRITNSVISLVFHPNQLDILFCGVVSKSSNQILVTKFSPARLTELTILHRLRCPDNTLQIVQITFHSSNSFLFCAHNEGLHAWDLNSNLNKLGNNEPDDFQVILPQPMSNTTDIFRTPEKMVDTVLSLTGTYLVACKIVNSEHIVVFDTKNVEKKNNKMKPNMYQLLTWADSDDAYLFLGWEPERKILGCGDHKGSVWLYNLADLKLTSSDRDSTPPSGILNWPKNLRDINVEAERKLQVGTYNILISQVALHENYVVSVTRTNFICVWKERISKD